VPITLIYRFFCGFQKVALQQLSYLFPPLTGGNKLIESEFLRQVSNSHAALFIKALRNKPLGNFSTFARSRTVVPTGTVTENGLELPGPG
tara:strand:- start:158 stop:427 length:270 start_codon:yes stop_codon:yes gene_type:complete